MAMPAFSAVTVLPDPSVGTPTTLYRTMAAGRAGEGAAPVHVKTSAGEQLVITSSQAGIKEQASGRANN